MQEFGGKVRWVLAGLFVLGGGLFVSAIRPLDDQGLDAAQHVVVLALVVLVTMGAAILSGDASWGRNLLRGVGLGVAISLLLYLWPPEIEGRADFQLRSLIAFAVSTASLLILTAGSGGFFVRWFGATVGIVLPPAALIGLLWVSCGSDGCWN